MTKSLDLLKISTSKTNQEAIDGKTTGLIFLNEFVTWRTKHFGFTQNLEFKTGDRQSINF